VKILRLDLLAFGPFTNTRLDFTAAENPLHLIYGPNEAGKSSCLRGLRAWLYGIPAQNSDNFLHAYNNMRVGGVLEGSRADRLEFVRRKGNSKTIRTWEEDQAIDQSDLNRILENLDQAAFEQRFAIDYQELQRGGTQIAQGTGQLAEILFSAGAGITHLRQVQRGLDEQLQGLFKSRGANAQINLSLKGLAESRAEIKRLSLATGDWEKHREMLAKAQQVLIDTTQQLDSARVRHHRYDRLLKAIPLEKKLSISQGMLDQVAEAAVLPSDFGERRSRAQDRLHDAEQRLLDARQEIERLTQMLQNVALPAAIFQHRAAITGLHTELGSFQKAAKDRPRLIAELRSMGIQAESCLERIGWPKDLEQARSFQLSLAQRKRTLDLASEWKSVLAERENFQRMSTKLRKAVEILESESPILSNTRNAEDLKRVHRRALRSVDSQQRLQQTRLELQATRQAMRVLLSGLPQYQGTVDDLEKSAFPLDETVIRFGREWKHWDDRIAKHGEKIEELENRIRHLESKIEQLKRQQDVPTEEDLQRARELRDLGWKLVRNVLAGEVSNLHDNLAIREFVEHYRGCIDLPQAYQASVQYADNLVDRLRREASRVLDMANWTVERHELLQQRQVEDARLRESQSEQQTLQTQWKNLWHAVGVEPLSPDEMRAWLQIRNELLEKNRQRILLETQTNMLETSIAESLAEIQRCLTEHNQAGVNVNGSLSEASEQCELLIQEVDAENQRRLLHAKELERLHGELTESEVGLRQSEDKLCSWRDEWRTVTVWLRQPEDLRPEVAQDLLREIDQLLNCLNEMEDLSRRITGIDRDAKEFEAKVQPLVTEVASDLELPVDQAVIELHLRLQAALATQSRIQQWQEQLIDQQSRFEKATHDKLHWQAEIHSLCAQAQCTAAEDLPDAEHRSRERLKYEAEVHQYQEALSVLAGSETLVGFLECVRSSDADLLSVDCQRLEEQLVELERSKAEAAKEVGACQADLNRMDGCSLAAGALEDAEHHLAAIRTGTEQYIRLRLADLLLRSSIERFRENNQGPILQRASQFFSELTLGSFSGMRADFDDKGDAVLVGVRPDGATTVGISGMSTGTCDQLYLALRLAMIESYVEEHHRVPFIIDDILIQFDDERSAAALKLLCDLAQKTQVIFFTHHHRIVELAQQRLPPGRWKFHDLASLSTRS
jgi:uncharacterized protein YhaN